LHRQLDGSCVESYRELRLESTAVRDVSVTKNNKANMLSAKRRLTCNIHLAVINVVEFYVFGNIA
jgi:hypothetical protein